MQGPSLHGRFSSFEETLCELQGDAKVFIGRKCQPYGYAAERCAIKHRGAVDDRYMRSWRALQVFKKHCLLHSSSKFLGLRGKYGSHDVQTSFGGCTSYTVLWQRFRQPRPLDRS